ncbi:MAG: hypothetical protein ACREXT_16045 [Gammaproteobacteria bacterium]
MTKAAIASAFRKLDAGEQANVLTELAAAHAESLFEEDRMDARVFEQRRREEPKARAWSQVRAKIDMRHARRRSSSG